ncbi:hypothetical protein M1L60_35420 [Actinoplanes sp. TRM 88003]|uniref:Uncharacterized protein n=1 Tax=Paractinoplanes aksuensis TaxID=2939490 RepID=A0ABT1DYC2_9ACTN|nr:hypothetical protein [Actinoplanes aksuensis]MCO8275882.1 hypothetical protein [Actinoplanes aksuensis]
MTWIVVSAAVIIALSAALAVWMRRRRRPVDKLAAARKATRQIRGSYKRPGDDIFRRGWGLPQRHAAAIAENKAYDAATTLDNNSGGGGSSD